MYGMVSQSQNKLVLFINSKVSMHLLYQISKLTKFYMALWQYNMFKYSPLLFSFLMTS